MVKVNTAVVSIMFSHSCKWPTCRLFVFILKSHLEDDVENKKN